MAMTPAELRALCLAAFGHEGQSAMARAIGMTPRHFRRLIAGTQPIGAEIEARIRKVLGAGEAAAPEWPRDEWILGDGAEHAPGERREYIVHARHPRFIARVVAIDELTESPEPHEGAVDNLTGIVYAAGDCEICEIVWIDPPPGPVALTALMEAAADALEKMS